MGWFATHCRCDETATPAPPQHLLLLARPGACLVNVRGCRRPGGRKTDWHGHQSL